MQEVKKYFKPEFINRIDKVVVFRSLKSDELKQITARLLDDLSLRAGKLGITLKYDGSALDFLSSVSESEQYGARPLRRKITDEVETELSRKIINHELKAGDSANIKAENNHIKILLNQDRKRVV